MPVSNARNILNLDAVDAYLARIRTEYENEHFLFLTSEAADWLTVSVRRWLVRTYPAFGRVVALLDAGGPDRDGAVRVDWDGNSGRRGRDTVQLPIPAWFQQKPDCDALVLNLMGPTAMDLVVPLVRALAFVDQAVRAAGPRGIARLSVGDAISHGGKLAARMEQARLQAQETAVLAFEDGYRVDLLSDRSALKAEGRAMSHCVGDYAVAVGRGVTEILSLRDRNGRSKVTLEVVGGRRVVQVAGKANSEIKPVYRPYIRRLATELGLNVDPDLAGEEAMPRAFDPDTPGSWCNRADVDAIIHQGLLGRGDADFERLEREVRAFLPQADHSTQGWIRQHFVGDPDGPVFACEVRDLDVFGARVPVYQIGVADDLWLEMNDLRLRSLAGLRDHMRETLISLAIALDDLCRHALLCLPGPFNELGVDWTPIRSARRQRMAAAAKGIGKTGTRMMRLPHVPEKRKEVWERNWQTLRFYLDHPRTAYF